MISMETSKYKCTISALSHTFSFPQMNDSLQTISFPKCPSQMPLWRTRLIMCGCGRAAPPIGRGRRQRPPTNTCSPVSKSSTMVFFSLSVASSLFPLARLLSFWLWQISPLYALSTLNFTACATPEHSVSTYALRTHEKLRQPLIVVLCSPNDHYGDSLYLLFGRDLDLH